MWGMWGQRGREEGMWGIWGQDGGVRGAEGGMRGIWGRGGWGCGDIRDVGTGLGDRV